MENSYKAQKRFNQTQIHFQYSYMSAAYVHVKDIPFKVSLLVVYFLLSFEPSVFLTYWPFLSEVHFCFHYALAQSKMSRNRTHQQKAIFAHKSVNSTGIRTPQLPFPCLSVINEHPALERALCDYTMCSSVPSLTIHFNPNIPVILSACLASIQFMPNIHTFRKGALWCHAHQFNPATYIKLYISFNHVLLGSVLPMLYILHTLDSILLKA